MNDSGKPAGMAKGNTGATFYMNRPVVLMLITLAIATFVSLFTGAPYLESTLPGGLPFGNALTSAGLMSASMAAIGVCERNTVIRWIAAVSLVLSVIWLPVSIWLAGNLALNFTEETGLMWIALSSATLILAFLSLIFAIVQTLKNGDRIGAH